MKSRQPEIVKAIKKINHHLDVISASTQRGIEMKVERWRIEELRKEYGE